MVLKSGTNQLRGSLYEYLRNSALDANLFFNNIIGQKLPVYQVNLFGGSLGGPVYIPKLFNGRNHAFFFFNYEGARQGQVSSSRLNMPTPTMRTGDFSQRPQQLYNPYSLSTVNGVSTRVPLPGNVIPASLMDPVGKNLLQYWPLPNVPGTTNALTGNFIQTTTFKGEYDMFAMKFDQSISFKQQTFFRLNWMPNAVVGNPYSFNGIANGATQSLRPSIGAAFSDTYIFSPKVAVDFRLGLSRGSNNGTFLSAQQGFNVATLGFSPQFASQIAEGPGFPQFTFSDGIHKPGKLHDLHHVLGQHVFQRRSGHHQQRQALVQGRPGHSRHSGQPIDHRRKWHFAFAQNQSGGPSATSPANGFGLASMLLGFAKFGIRRQ